MRYFCLLLFFLFSSKNFASQSIIDLRTQPYVNIGREVSIFEDQSGALSVDEIEKIDQQNKFRPSATEILNLGNTKSAFWVKIKYKNTSDHAGFLVVDVPNIEYIDLYIPVQGKKVCQLHSGCLAAPEEEVIAGANYIFSLPEGDTVPEGRVIYLRVKSDNTMLLALKMASAKTLVAGRTFKTSFEAMYCGLILTLFLFNLFLFFRLKDVAYLYYSIYVATLFIYLVLYIRGYGYMLGENGNRFVNTYPHIFACMASLSAIFFSWKFLELRTRLPNMVRIYQLMMLTWMVFLVIAAFGGKSILAVWVNYLILVCAVILLYSGIKVYSKGHKAAMYFILAWFFITLTFIIVSLGVSGIINYHDFSYEVGPIGSSLELLLLAFALGERFNKIRRERMLIQKENLELIKTQNFRLEMVVKERTSKFLEAVQDLEKSNAVKDKLFSIIAHDLRSPFHSLISIFSLKDMDLLDFEELKMLLNQSRKNIDKILQTLDDLLLWAKSQMAFASTQFSYFDLKILMEEMMLVYQPLSTSKSIVIDLEIAGDTGVYADLNQVQLIMRNLIDNAIKFTPGGETIGLTIEEGKGRVFISIYNPILEQDAEKLGRLLNAGVDLSSPGLASQMGVGLGLHLCREYVKVNGGDLRIKVQDHTVTFHFSIPKRASS